LLSNSFQILEFGFPSILVAHFAVAHGCFISCLE